MEREQAAKFLMQVLANIQATRQQHDQFQQAVAVLLAVPAPVKKEK